MTCIRNIPILSAIMIVKNEEDHLARCLESIQEQVDEIVVVDTGSTDRTMEIAEGYGAKIFEHPWEDDFSKHRNQSIQYATGDWLFQIDADEKLINRSGLTLKEAIQACDDVDAILVTLESQWENGYRSLHNSIRLFKNLPRIHYKGRVHNEVVGMHTGKYMPLRIFHYGYDLDEETLKRKFNRTVKILLQDIRDDPNNPRAYHYLGISYLSRSMYKEAIQKAEKAIALCRRHKNRSDLYSGSYYVAATAHVHLGDLNRAEYWAKEALFYYPMHLDSLFILSEIYFKKHNLPLFFHYTNDYIKQLEELETSGEGFGMFILQTTGFKWLGHLYKACAWLDLGHQKRGEQELERAHACTPDKAHYYHLLAGYYRKKEWYKQSEEAFKKALDAAPNHISILWDFARLRKQQNDLDGAKSLFQRIIQTDPEYKNAIFELGNISLRMNAFEESIHYYQRVLRIDKRHIQARLNMALALRKVERFEDSIRHSLKIIKDHPQSMEALSNLAHAHYGLGDMDGAAEYFLRISTSFPDQLDTHVYLALIFLAKNDIESCIYSCDYLLRLLHLDRDRVIYSLADLGNRFLAISRKMSAMNMAHLSGICLEIGHILTVSHPAAEK